LLPLGRERARGLGLLRLRAHGLGSDELEPSDDAFPVDPPEKTSRCFGSDAGSLGRNVEPDQLASDAGACRPEQGSRAGSGRAVGVCRALEDGDVIASTHRAHGHTLAKGTHPNEIMAELYGKQEGCSHGYGGSMHLYDVERGNLGANAVVGGGLPQIAGAALAFKLRGEPRVALSFFGDGATNIGTFHEALNLAQLWQVPAVFVLEDNKWAESTPESQHSPIRDLSERAKAFGMKALKADGQDVEVVYRTARKALDHARGGDGPVFVHLETIRFSGHYIGDPQVYRV